MKRVSFIQIFTIKPFIKKNRKNTEPNRGFLLYRTEPNRTEGLANRHTPTQDCIMNLTTIVIRFKDKIKKEDTKKCIQFNLLSFCIIMEQFIYHL